MRRHFICGHKQPSSVHRAAFSQKKMFCPSTAGGETTGNLVKAIPRFGEFCSCCCSPLLPQLACSILATWERPYCRPRLSSPSNSHLFTQLLFFCRLPSFSLRNFKATVCFSRLCRHPQSPLYLLLIEESIDQTILKGRIDIASLSHL